MAIAVEYAVAGYPILWASPTFDQVRIGWYETKHAVGSMGKFTQQRMTVEFPGGGQILYRSLDNPDNARGHTAAGVVIDEASIVKEAAWYEVLLPMLVDTGGWAWGIGTPKGRNWFWREHAKAQERDDSMSWQIPTLGVEIVGGKLIRKAHPLENPNIAFEEIERLSQSMPERIFRQEILAEFLEDAGSVFRHVTACAIAEPRHKAGRCVFGVDWGKHEDWTVISVMDAAKGEMIGFHRYNKIDYTFQVDRLKAWAKRYKPVAILAESNAMGEPLIDQLRRDGLPVRGFTTTKQSKAEVINELALAFDQQEIRILPEPVLIGELQAFEMTQLPAGGWRYAAPEGMHDDCVISLALAWHAAKGGRRAGIMFTD